MTYPNKIDSNATGAAYAEELTIKTLPGSPVWYGLEPNSYSKFGGTVTTVARKPIVTDRQQRKGSVSDFMAEGSMVQDITPTNLTRLLQGFMFANAREKPTTQSLVSSNTPISFTSVAVSGVYNAASGLSQFVVGDIVLASGFASASNNGIGVVTASATGSVTCAAKTTVADASPAAGAMLQAVGAQFTTGDAFLTYAAPLLTLGTTTYNLTTLGLSVGEWVYIGGDAAGTYFANVPTGGFARIASIAAHAITFDKTTFTPTADAGTGKTIQIYFGSQVLQNEPLPANIVRRTYNVERTLGNDGTGTQAEYLLGAVPNTFKINMPANGLLSADIAFAALSQQVNTGATGVKAGTRVAAPGEYGFSTTADLYRARVAAVDPTTLNPTPYFGYIATADVQITNGVVANKALGVLGGFDASAGNFVVSGNIMAMFTNVGVISAIRAFADVTIDFIFVKKQTGIVIDLPLIGLGGGELNVTIDKPIEIPLTTEAYKGANGYTAMLCFFPYLPVSSTPSN